MKLFLSVIGILLAGTVLAKDEVSSLPKNRVDVYYLHNTFRCMSCNTIESLTKAAVFGGTATNQKYKNSITVKPVYEALCEKNVITFNSVNIDLPKNAHFLKDFNAQVKFPVLVLVKGGKIVKTKVLGNVWDLMNNNQNLVGYIRKNLNVFLKLVK